MSGTEPEKPTWIADVRADEPTIKALLDILKLKNKGTYTVGTSRFKSKDDTVGIYVEYSVKPQAQ